MSLFSGITNTIGNVLGGGPAQRFEPQTTQLDPAMLQQFQQDIGGVRSLANTPVTGLNTAGRAATDLARTAYQDQLEGLFGQQGSQLATAQANLGRFGADAGSAERLATQNMRQGLLGQQQLGRANVQNLANIAAQNTAQQEQNRVGALMALPQISQAPLSMQLGVDQANAGLMNQANLANMSADAVRRQNIGSALGSIGQIGGLALGGPMGGAIGGMIGGQLGGLFA